MFVESVWTSHIQEIPKQMRGPETLFSNRSERSHFTDVSFIATCFRIRKQDIIYLYPGLFIVSLFLYSCGVNYPGEIN